MTKLSFFVRIVHSVGRQRCEDLVGAELSMAGDYRPGRGEEDDVMRTGMAGLVMLVAYSVGIG